MEDKVTGLIGIIFGGLLALLLIASLISQNNRITTLEESRELSSIEIRLEKPDFWFKDPKDGLMEALVYYNIPYPEIVYTQAYIATNNFNKYKSNVNSSGNLFNLYNTKLDKYMSFDHWVGSVECYKKCFSDNYDSTEDYYDFLKRTINNPEYIEVLKQTHQKLFQND